jgi:3-hydroxybutyryl-CoA dehydrogenase
MNFIGKNIAVVGAGTMGNGIAHVFAQAGFKVTIVDISPAQLDRAMVTINKNLDRQVSKGSITEAQKKKHLKICPSIPIWLMASKMLRLW